MRLLRTIVLLPLALAVMGFGSGERLFAPGADLWAKWQASDPASTVQIDHQSFDELLAEFASIDPGGVVRVDYRALQVSGGERLRDYLEALQSSPVSGLSRGEQMAFWINLYNAATLMVVAEHYPVQSIRDIDISPGLFSSGPWGKQVVQVEDEAMSLNDIEHRILRPVFKDPRIHYAVNCASVGCPNLGLKAYRGATIEADLEEAARLYVNHARGVSINGGQVSVSRIYDWFIEDFGGSEEGVLAHLRRYAELGLKDRLAAIGALHDTHYDWSLNDIAR